MKNLTKVKGIIRNLRACVRLSLKAKMEYKKPFILMYHRVLRNPEDEIFPVQPGLYVKEKTFDMHLRHLKSNYEIVFVEELLERLFNGDPLDGKCAITFDDGWQDNYLYAFPILEKNKVPSSFFLATKFIDTNNWFWEEEVSFFINSVPPKFRKKIFEKDNISKHIEKLFQRVSQDDVDGITRVVFCLKNIEKKEFFQIINKIKKQNRFKKANKRLMMSWSEIKEMNNSGLAKFYSHTHSHSLLTDLSEKQIEKEIYISNKIIQNRLSFCGNLFCYPSGMYNSEIVSVLKKANVNFALSTERGFLLSDEKRYHVKRIGVHDSISNNLCLFRNLLV